MGFEFLFFFTFVFWSRSQILFFSAQRWWCKCPHAPTRSHTLSHALTRSHTHFFLFFYFFSSWVKKLWSLETEEKSLERRWKMMFDTHSRTLSKTHTHTHTLSLYLYLSLTYKHSLSSHTHTLKHTHKMLFTNYSPECVHEFSFKCLILKNS